MKSIKLKKKFKMKLASLLFLSLALGTYGKLSLTKYSAQYDLNLKLNRMIKESIDKIIYKV